MNNYTSPVNQKQVKALLHAVNDGAVPRADAMVALGGISQATLYRRKAKLGIKRPPGVRKRASTEAASTRAARQTAAQMVMDGRLTFEEGLALAQIHRTTLQRIIDRMKASAQ